MNKQPEAGALSLTGHTQTGRVNTIPAIYGFAVHITGFADVSRNLNFILWPSTPSAEPSPRKHRRRHTLPTLKWFAQIHDTAHCEANRALGFVS